MQLTSKWLLGLVLGPGLFVSVALGHGGRPYSTWTPPPPPPEPERDFDIKVPFPPPGGLPPGTSGPSSGPGLPPVGPGGPIGPGPGTGPGVAGPATLGKKSRVGKGASGTDGWEIWWRYNQAPYLHADGSRQAPVWRSSRSVFLTGMGRKDSSVATPGLTDREAGAHVLPTLLEMLAQDDPEIVDSAAIALGRVARDVDVERAVVALESTLGTTRDSVQQAALLALGILRHRSSVPALWSVMNDTRQGREHLDTGSPISDTHRAFAAMAMGLAGGRDMVRPLVRLIERAPKNGTDPEVVAGSVLALGLLEGADIEVVAFLMERLEDARLDRQVRAQIPIALARLGDVAVPAVPSLLRRLRDRRAESTLRQSCAIALGRLASVDDVEVITALRKTIANGGQATLRHFAYMALARIGARGVLRAAVVDPDRVPPMVDEIGRLLSRELIDPRRGTDRPWAALALGVIGYEMSDSSPTKRRWIEDLSHELARTGNPVEEGAFAVGLGLLGARDAGSMLLERFRDRNGVRVRGHLAQGLGLMRYEAARGDLRHELFETSDAGLRLDVATSLSLLGERDAAAELARVLAVAPTFAQAVSIARAVGRLGDLEAVGPLAATVRDDTRPPIVRGLSCVALGMIGERSELPWYVPFAVDCNYASGLRVQGELLDIF